MIGVPDNESYDDHDIDFEESQGERDVSKSSRKYSKNLIKFLDTRILVHSLSQNNKISDLKKRIKAFVINKLGSPMMDPTMIMVLIFRYFEVKNVVKCHRKYLRILQYFLDAKFSFKPHNYKFYHF